MQILRGVPLQSGIRIERGGHPRSLPPASASASARLATRDLVEKRLLLQEDAALFTAAAKASELRSQLASAPVGASSLGAQTGSRANLANADLERRFDASINPSEMGGWMKTMAADAHETI
jgi:hypothetical protein